MQNVSEYMLVLALCLVSVVATSDLDLSELALLLQDIADNGASAFYTGDVADDIVDVVSLYYSSIFLYLLLWPLYRIGQASIFLPCGFFFYLSILFLFFLA